MRAGMILWLTAPHPRMWRLRHRNGGYRMRCYRIGNHLLVTVALVLSALIGGCATGGPSGPLPMVQDPLEASNVTVYRGGSLVGLFSPIRLQINGQNAFRIHRNQQYSFQLDPGLHLFEFYIGLNECRRVIFIEPRRSYRIRLVPNCVMETELN